MTLETSGTDPLTQPTAGSAEVSDPLEGEQPGQISLPGPVPEGHANTVRVTVETLAEDGSLLDRRTVVLCDPGQVSLPLPDGAQVQVSLGSAPGVEAAAAADRPGSVNARSWRFLRARAAALDTSLLWLGLALYVLVRLVGLADFPIYFFTDEAVQTVQAADLVAQNFATHTGEVAPTFFVNGSQYNLGTSVYLQVIPYLFFGKSVFVTRAVSVFATALAALAIGLILRDFLRVRYWWCAPLLLSAAPAWFLHSRTAFETVLMCSFYAGFLYYYLRYRLESPRSLYPALGLGALAFYTYSPGQVVMLVSGLFLLIFDWRYHWHNRWVCLRGLGLLALLGLPYLRFLLLHPQENLRHLQMLGSYWVEHLSLGEKLGRFSREYLVGLSPGYWFIPNERDLDRHLMKGYGHLYRASLPFFALGLALALKNFRSPAQRVLLGALLAAPSGAALAQVGITRALVFILPATLLTACGLSAGLGWLERRRIPQAALSAVLFAGLAAANLWMLNDALRNGPTWYADYGLGGMQYGARQVFPAAQQILKEAPETRIILSPTWSNGTDVVARFFLPTPLPLQMGSIEGYLTRRLELDDHTLFIMTPEEYRLAATSRKFKEMRVEKTLPYPNGQPGFYFVRLRYADDFDAQIAAEVESRRVLQENDLALQNTPVRVRYSMLDMGEIQNVFDGDPNTLVRTLEVNPLVVELIFQALQPLDGVSVRIGGTATRVRAELTLSDQPKPLVFEKEVPESSDFRSVGLDFGRKVTAERLRLEILNVYDVEPAHVHVWEIELK